MKTRGRIPTRCTSTKRKCSLDALQYSGFGIVNTVTRFYVFSAACCFIAMLAQPVLDRSNAMDSCLVSCTFTLVLQSTQILALNGYYLVVTTKVLEDQTCSSTYTTVLVRYSVAMILLLRFQAWCRVLYLYSRRVEAVAKEATLS